MMIRLVAVFTCVVLFIAIVASAEGVPSMVRESARELPVTHDVDVLVVGGASAGVAAALAADAAGASALVVARETFLGEDLCGSYRLWLAPGDVPDTPLGNRLFTSPVATSAPKQGLPFTYMSSLPSAPKHADSPTRTGLRDGKWQSAPAESVQYDGAVTILADLGKRTSLTGVTLYVYQRPDDFEVASVTVQLSDDKQTWRQAATVANPRPGTLVEGDALAMFCACTGDARYVRLDVQKTDASTRVLLAELVISSDAADDTADEPTRYPPTPMHVKRTLEQSLVKADVPFLFGCFPTDVLFDAKGRPAGLVIANRSGRQVVRARVIIDATPRATVARLAGAGFSPYPAGEQRFSRIVIGGVPPDQHAGERRELPVPVMTPRGALVSAYEYTLSIPMRDGSFASFAAAEQEARDGTWHRDQVEGSDAIFQVPPDPMVARSPEAAPWEGAGALSMDALRPADLDCLYVLGGCAGVSRAAAAALLRPAAYLACGVRVGKEAAREAAAVPAAATLRFHCAKPPAGDKADTGEPRNLLQRGDRKDVVAAPERGLAVIGAVDVLVVGGGTGGAPAGLGAARAGARTLVVEYLDGLGGVGTYGLISVYYHGNRVGFTAEMDAGVKALGSAARRGWKPETKMEWYRSELRKAGCGIWFGTLGCGAYVEDGRVKGVVVATPQGRGVVLAKAVVDATGAAAIAACAGAPCVFTDGSGIAVQGTGLPPRELGTEYTNTDYTFIDDEDPLDICRAFVLGREKFKHAYDMGELIDTRERRQILGDLRITPFDIHLGRRYRDTVTISKSNFDSHGYTIHPMFFIWPPDHKGFAADVPLRALIPRGIRGVLVTGLGISAHRDAMPILRMQPDIQNQGYAAGRTAAMAAARGVDVREIDIRALQRHLVETGILPERVLSDKDGNPVDSEGTARAVTRFGKDITALPSIMVNPDIAIPLLKKALLDADDANVRLRYAHVLAVMGDPLGADVLIDKVMTSGWDKGWRFRGMGQFGRSVSPIDGYIISLGLSGDKRAVPVLVEKVKSLEPTHALSHHRAVAEAVERFRDPVAARPLADLLGKPGMTGHAMTELSKAMEVIPKSSTDNTSREVSLRELMLARALYRCGDCDGLGQKTLETYAGDLRAHYARHAQAVLAESH